MYVRKGRLHVSGQIKDLYEQFPFDCPDFGSPFDCPHTDLELSRTETMWNLVALVAIKLWSKIFSFMMLNTIIGWDIPGHQVQLIFISIHCISIFLGWQSSNLDCLSKSQENKIIVFAFFKAVPYYSSWKEHKKKPCMCPVIFMLAIRSSSFLNVFRSQNTLFT